MLSNAYSQIIMGVDVWYSGKQKASPVRKELSIGIFCSPSVSIARNDSTHHSIALQVLYSFANAKSQQYAYVAWHDSYFQNVCREIYSILGK